MTSVAKVGKISAQEMAKEYDMRFGRPSEKTQTSLQKTIFKIQNVKSYEEFFKRVKLPPPSKEFLLQLLRECVQESAKKKYHK